MHKLNRRFSTHWSTYKTSFSCAPKRTTLPLSNVLYMWIIHSPPSQSIHSSANSNNVIPILNLNRNLILELDNSASAQPINLRETAADCGLARIQCDRHARIFSFLLTKILHFGFWLRFLRAFCLRLFLLSADLPSPTRIVPTILVSSTLLSIFGWVNSVFSFPFCSPSASGSFFFPFCWSSRQYLLRHRLLLLIFLFSIRIIPFSLQYHRHHLQHRLLLLISSISIFSIVFFCWSPASVSSASSSSVDLIIFNIVFFCWSFSSASGSFLFPFSIIGIIFAPSSSVDLPLTRSHTFVGLNNICHVSQRSFFIIGQWWFCGRRREFHAQTTAWRSSSRQFRLPSQLW